MQPSEAIAKVQPSAVPSLKLAFPTIDSKPLAEPESCLSPQPMKKSERPQLHLSLSGLGSSNAGLGSSNSSMTNASSSSNGLGSIPKLSIDSAVRHAPPSSASSIATVGTVPKLNWEGAVTESRRSISLLSPTSASTGSGSSTTGSSIPTLPSIGSLESTRRSVMSTTRRSHNRRPSSQFNLPSDLSASVSQQPVQPTVLSLTDTELRRPMRCESPEPSAAASVVSPTSLQQTSARPNSAIPNTQRSNASSVMNNAGGGITPNASTTAAVDSDPLLHAYLLRLLLMLLVDSDQSQLSPKYCGRFPLARVQTSASDMHSDPISFHVLFILQHHLLHPRNANVLPLLSAHLPLIDPLGDVGIGSDQVSSTIACLPFLDLDHHTGTFAGYFRLLRLLSPCFFTAQLYKRQKLIGRGRYAQVYTANNPHDSALPLLTRSIATGSADAAAANAGSSSSSAATSGTDMSADPLTPIRGSTSVMPPVSLATATATAAQRRASRAYSFAISEAPNCRYALKIVEIPPLIHDHCVLFDLFTEISILDRFRSSSAAESNSSIAALIDYGRVQNQLWLVMQYYPTSARSFRNRMRSGVPIPAASSGSGSAKNRSASAARRRPSVAAPSSTTTTDSSAIVAEDGTASVTQKRGNTGRRFSTSVVNSQTRPASITPINDDTPSSPHRVLARLSESSSSTSSRFPLLPATSAFSPIELFLYLRLYHQICLGIQSLHRSHVVHFDLKCDNVLLDVTITHPPPSTALVASQVAPPTNMDTLIEYLHEQAAAMANLRASSDSISTQYIQHTESHLDWLVRHVKFHVAIADFGESMVGPSQSSRFARGTEQIQSPEMLQLSKTLDRQHESYDRRRHHSGASLPSDVWSLGCMLYELCTGSFLFDESRSSLPIFFQVTSDKQPILTDPQIALLCPEIIQLLQYVLVRDQRRRPQIHDILKRVESTFIKLYPEHAPISLETHTPAVPSKPSRARRNSALDLSAHVPQLQRIPSSIRADLVLSAITSCHSDDCYDILPYLSIGHSRMLCSRFDSCGIAGQRFLQMIDCSTIDEPPLGWAPSTLYLGAMLEKSQSSAPPGDHELVSLQVLMSATDFAHECITNRRPCLVVSNRGCCRAPTVAVCYLIRHRRMAVAEAIALVRRCHLGFELTPPMARLLLTWTVVASVGLT